MNDPNDGDPFERRLAWDRMCKKIQLNATEMMQIILFMRLKSYHQPSPSFPDMRIEISSFSVTIDHRYPFHIIVVFTYIALNDCLEATEFVAGRCDTIAPEFCCLFYF